MTPRQSTVLNFIREFCGEKGFSPSYDEIIAGTNVRSRGQVFNVVHQLAKAGHITTTPNRSRSIEVVDQSALAPGTAPLRLVKEADLALTHLENGFISKKQCVRRLRPLLNALAAGS